MPREDINSAIRTSLHSRLVQYTSCRNRQCFLLALNQNAVLLYDRYLSNREGMVGFIRMNGIARRRSFVVVVAGD